MKSRIISTPFLIILGLILIMISCNNAEKDWLKAKSTNTITAYQDFLKNHSSNEFSENAKFLIDSIEWTALVSTHNIDSLKQFINNHTSSKFIINSKIAIDKMNWLFAYYSNEWVDIPGGTFTMGSATNYNTNGANSTPHDVTLNSFRMSKYEVNIAQFKAFVDETGYITDAEKGSLNVEGSGVWNGNGFDLIKNVNWKCDERGNLRPSSEYNFPVVHVSWNDAKAFAEWMGCRLPTEGEWEYACRAGTNTQFNTGTSLSTLQANYNGNNPYSSDISNVNLGKLQPIGSYAPNNWGLYDMHGNVWEWCNDWLGDYPATAQTNPIGPTTGSFRVIRGGCYIFNARNCSSARRDHGYPGERSGVVGFRIVTNNNVNKQSLANLNSLSEKKQEIAWNDNEHGYFSDVRDNKKYKIVKIGKQIWMAENLAYKDSDGCWAYENKQSNVLIYGYLYNWETAIKVVPKGWHLPSNEEWGELKNHLGGNNEITDNKMKEEGTSHWKSSNQGANNQSEFSALPGGIRTKGSFKNIGIMGVWWSATENQFGTTQTAATMGLTFDNSSSNFGLIENGKSEGFSIRCIRD